MFKLDQQIEFRNGSEVDLGLKDPTRKIVYRGDVSQKSGSSLMWVRLHLILLDNYLIMTEKRIEQGMDRYFVSKRVRCLQMYLIQPILLDLLVLESLASPVQSQVAKGSSIYRAVSRFDRMKRFSFRLSDLASGGTTYTLYTESAIEQQTWVDQIMEAKKQRAAFRFETEPFQANIVAETVFG